MQRFIEPNSHSLFSSSSSWSLDSPWGLLSVIYPQIRRVRRVDALGEAADLPLDHAYRYMNARILEETTATHGDCAQARHVHVSNT
ncbi:hypothetical protein PGTUg99_001143 [Puccinia graminis f. sp. tritici]|uniref:Uncharacterized protein n=1 Tax=Puccinia graminis f. sp. tritici TaxID=56615 RepID=A0A5B0RIQ6_PUCGR|nr:hypothetical protein PGTUg99_001143 [Puccinia graminis f. sp. tritici]